MYPPQSNAENVFIPWRHHVHFHIEATHDKLEFGVEHLKVRVCSRKHFLVQNFFFPLKGIWNAPGVPSFILNNAAWPANSIRKHYIEDRRIKTECYCCEKTNPPVYKQTNGLPTSRLLPSIPCILTVVQFMYVCILHSMMRVPLWYSLIIVESPW